MYLFFYIIYYLSNYVNYFLIIFVILPINLSIYFHILYFKQPYFIHLLCFYLQEFDFYLQFCYNNQYQTFRRTDRTGSASGKTIAYIFIRQKGLFLMKQTLLLNLNNTETLSNVGKALSAPVRLEILEYLAKSPAIISEIAAAFKLPLSSTALHIRVLESAGLIFVRPIPGSKGSQKLCSIQIDKIQINMFQEEDAALPDYLYRESMPVGSYFDYSVMPSCGMASEQNYLGFEDNISVFVSPCRYKAQLIWLSCGFLEYRFSNIFFKSNSVNRVRFSFEICSEALGYNNDWPSDITISVNTHEIGILHCRGDFGGRKGVLNPDWWYATSSQYGELRTFEITDEACYIDGIQVSRENIYTLGVPYSDYIKFRLESKRDARYCGGFNLFGEKFGDYPQDIVMELYNDEKE